MNHYRLPRQPFKCGNSPTGEPCPFGPVRGRCSQSKSDSNSKDCRPLRTLIWWSRSIQVSATLLALIAVSLAWSNLGGKQSLAPGPLSRAHAQLLVAAHHNNDGELGILAESRCASCHPGGHAATVGAMQSDLCLKCHIQEMPDAVHGSPHDLHGKSLEELVANGDRLSTKSNWTKLVNRSPIAWQNQSLECSQCHREHQGATHDLNEMTSERCQACHRNAFHSFSSDHPEFKDYPYGRTKSVEFDHVKHRDLHFSKKSAAFDCKTCHVQSGQVGVVGQVFRSVAFEQACASCHTEPIKSATQDGLIVLQIPSINLKEMKGFGEEILNWPMQASLLTDGAIPPIMRMLIESEPGGIALLGELPASGRLVELDTTDSRSRATLVKLSVMTKQLMQKLANEGQPGFRSAVENLLSTSGPLTSTLPSESKATPNSWLDRFASGIPPDLFRAAWNEWFEAGVVAPAIGQTVAHASSTFPSTRSPRGDDDLLLGNDDNLLSNDPNSLVTPSAIGNSKSERFKDSRSWDQLAFGGWMIDRQRMAIVYVPNGHADPWLSRWIELEEQRQGTLPEHKIALAHQCRQCHSLSSLNQSNSPVSKSNRSVSFREANQSKFRLQMLSGEHENACWKSEKRAANLRQITKFDHTPHLTLPRLSDCRTCHQLNANSSPVFHQPEFAPMKKSQCTDCHQKNAAGESCTQCHDYHVGIKGWTQGQTQGH
jgi:Zn finger protein HypA/HybF involved in hydrogenase expression